MDNPMGWRHLKTWCTSVLGGVSGVGGQVVLALLLTACATSEAPTSQRTIAFSHVIDLSHTLTQNMPHQPGDLHTRIIRSSSPDTIQAIQLNMRSGTSLRLPATVAPQSTLDQRSPRELIAPAVVLDVRDTSQDTPHYRLSADEILRWEQQHRRIPAGCMVLLATGWDIRWGNTPAYLNLDAQQRLQVPSVDATALRLLRERSISGLGIDTPQLIPPLPDTPLTEASLVQPEWLLLENLTNLEQLPATGTTLSIGALKIQHSTTSPVRVLALVP